MTNRDGADVQQARQYVTSKQGNIQSAENNSASSSESSSFSSSAGNMAGSFSSSADTNLNSGTIQKEIQEARKATTK